ncbi:MAG: hypothetical protein RSD47_11645 [Romboutsia sp.]
MDINYFKSSIYNGMNFHKVKGVSQILNVVDDGFTYAIGKNGNYKKVTYDEVENAIYEIEQRGYINRKWFEETFPKIAKSKPCNFTSIGGVLQALDYVTYVEKRYQKIIKYDLK